MIESGGVPGGVSSKLVVTLRPDQRAESAATALLVWLAGTIEQNRVENCFGAGIQLVDFKIECGRLWEGDMMRVVVADEISPDSCRLWDIATNEKMDKDRFRRDLGGMLEAYREVARRLGIMNENEPPRGKGPVLVKTDK